MRAPRFKANSKESTMADNGSKNTLSITDNRTGKQYEVDIQDTIGEVSQRQWLAIERHAPAFQPADIKNRVHQL